jgi:hypothetical protein
LDRGWLTSGRWYLNCDSCLKETHVRTGHHIVRMVDRSFLYRNLERIWDWSSTERRPDVLLKRLDGYKLDRTFSTQWRVRTEMHVVRTDDAWSDWRPDGMSRHPDGWNSGQMGVRTGCLDRPDGWQGIEIYNLSHSSKSSKSALNSGISFYSIFTHKSDFVQNEAKILTEIADSTLTVRTTAYHSLNARIADMEIACWSSAVRMLIPLGSNARSLIRKLLAMDVRPSGQLCLTVRKRLSNRKDFQWKSWKILSHCCPSGWPMSTVRTASIHITVVVHSAPQPINRSP